MNQIEIYRTKDKQIQIQVRFEGETAWLSLTQIAELFGRDKSVISRHLKNVFDSGELVRKSVVAKNATTASDGKTYDVEYFNLDAIISVGYRVNSLQGTRFRQWATTRLQEYLVKGYTVNERRLKELQQTIRLISDVALRRDLSGDEAKALLRVVSDYSYALDVLDDYDHQRISVRGTTGGAARPVTYDEAVRIINTLRQKFNASGLFGKEKDKSLHSSLNAVFQTFGRNDVYPSIEEKASHLLYFLVKNHSFADGNKRIAAALFLWFMEKNNILYGPDGAKRIGDNALVAMTLLIAESKPADKEILTRVVTNLINKKNK